MGYAHFSFAVPAAPDASPNTTTPVETRTWAFPVANLSFGSRVWMVPIGGGCTVQLWAWEKTTQRWYTVNTATALAQDTQTLFGASVVPLGVPLFAQVTVVGAATQVIGGLVET